MVQVDQCVKMMNGCLKYNKKQHLTLCWAVLTKLKVVA